jgi:hypothetical protein
MNNGTGGLVIWVSRKHAHLSNFEEDLIVGEQDMVVGLGGVVHRPAFSFNFNEG